MYIRVRVTPGAKKEQVTKVNDTEFEMRVREPAERNLANKRVGKLIAEACGVSEKQVKLISGHRSPTKVFDVEGF